MSQGHRCRLSCEGLSPSLPLTKRYLYCRTLRLQPPIAYAQAPLFAVWIRMPPRYTSSADIHAMVARIAPSILELLGDGVWRSRKAIIAALAGQHEKDEVVRTLMRLAVIGQVVDVDGKYGLPRPYEASGGWIG